jgi:predicted Zn-dependent protease with MMP-like domain
MKPNWDQMCRIAEGEIAQILAELPEPLRERAKMVPVALERQPNPAMQADGIEVDTLGLFTGPEWAAAGEVPMPPQITLYLENVWQAAETDGKRFHDEIATTFLHELGHFFGFDEAGLGEMGLE